LSLVTVVIPVGPQHKAAGIYKEAIQSVQAQTVPAEYIVVFDEQGKGAAHARNRGTSQVDTPFVIWLDADDLLRPAFIEETLKYYRPGAFVYMDWVVNGLIINTPDILNPFDIGQEHVTPTLMPVAAWEAVGGFDESLDTLEDEDFYRKLASFGWCGVRCPEPLIEYRRRLGHSLVNLETVETDTQKQRVAEKAALFANRYGRHKHMSQDCGCNTPQPGQPSPVLGERQPNDVLVETLYTPQKVQGAMTKRLYPRAGLGKRLWVHEDDARSRPDLFRIIGPDPVKVSPDVATVKHLTQEAIAREQEIRGSNASFAEDKPDFASMLKPELLAYAQKHGIEVQGTGSRGSITKDDLLAVLMV